MKITSFFFLELAALKGDALHWGSDREEVKERGAKGAAKEKE